MTDQTHTLSDINQTIARNIRQARLQAGLSPGDLARRVGLSTRLLVNSETGMTHVPGAMLVLVARELNIPVEWFLSPGAASDASRIRQPDKITAISAVG